MLEAQDKIYYLLADNYATAAASPHLEQLRGERGEGEGRSKKLRSERL